MSSMSTSCCCLSDLTPMKVVVSGTGRNLPSKKNNPVNEIPVTLESQTRFKPWPLSYFRNEYGKNDLATKKLGHFGFFRMNSWELSIAPHQKLRKRTRLDLLAKNRQSKKIT